MQTNIWRKFSLILRLVGLCGLLGSLSGCTVSAISHMTDVKDVYSEPINDQLSGFEKESQDSTQKAVEEQTVVFFGKQRIYVLNKGGEQTLYLVQALTSTPELDPKKLRLILRNDERLSTSDEQVVQGKMDFSYVVANMESCNREREALHELGFEAKDQAQAHNQNQEFYQSISVAGFIKRTPNTNNAITEQSEHQREHFTSKISLILHEAKEMKKYINPLPVLALPFAVIADVLLSPIYIVIWVTTVLTWEGKSHRW